jgi:hypothetical protein
MPSDQLVRSLCPQTNSYALYTLRPTRTLSMPSDQLVRSLYPQTNSYALYGLYYILNSNVNRERERGEEGKQNILKFVLWVNKNVQVGLRALYPQTNLYALYALRPTRTLSIPSDQLVRSLCPQTNLYILIYSQNKLENVLLSFLTPLPLSVHIWGRNFIIFSS